METIFTKIIDGTLPGFIPFKTETLAVLITLEGHPIIVPRYPYKDIYELPDDVAADIMQTAVRVARALKAATNCEGVNLIQSNEAAAGQDVFHFHVHLKQRFTNDDVTLSWDTTVQSDERRSSLSEKIKAAL